jgi:hypothetical protein
VGAQLAAVAVVAVGAFAVAFATALAVSAIRGGRGIPDLRLLADGALAVTLGGWVGMAVGWRSGSRMLSVLAAPVWWAACQIVGDWPSGLGAPPSLAVERLSPLLGLTEHSAEFGFLPDPLWPHLGYLLGLVLLAGVGLLALAARGGGQRPPVVPLLAAMLAGVVLVTAGGVGLVTLPRWLVVLGPDRADWKPASEVLAIDDRSWTYPDDGHARSCAGDATLTACVYPAYGQRLAGEIHGAMGPVAELFAGLPGVPTRARMVPTQTFVHSACRGSEVQFGEPDVRALSGNAPASAFLAAARTSILDGGAAAMATTVGLTAAGRAWPAWFPIQLASVPGDPRWHSSQVWMVGLSLALAASALLAERRTGLALRLRRRRPTSRPSPASGARVRP